MFFLLSSLIVIHFFAVATPGPDFFYVSQVAASESRKNGFKAVAGITVGFVVWASIALLGLNVVIQKMAWLHQGIMILGGLYLCYMAFLLVQSAIKKQLPKKENAVIEVANVKRKAFFIKGVLTNLSNAKVLVYFSSIFSLILTDDLSNLMKWMILFTVIIETILWFSLVAFIFSLPVIKKKYHSFAKWIDGFAGVIFGAFGLALIYKAAIVKP